MARIGGGRVMLLGGCSSVRIGNSVRLILEDYWSSIQSNCKRKHINLANARD